MRNNQNTQHNKQGRPSNNKRGKSRKNNNNNNQPLNANRQYDSHGPTGKQRGNVKQLIEKYKTLAREHNSDRHLRESLMQFADHYQRLHNEIQEQENANKAKREADRQERQERHKRNRQHHDNNEQKNNPDAKAPEVNTSSEAQANTDSPQKGEQSAKAEAAKTEAAKPDTAKPDTAVKDDTIENTDKAEAQSNNISENKPNVKDEPAAPVIERPKRRGRPRKVDVEAAKAAEAAAAIEAGSAE